MNQRLALALFSIGTVTAFAGSPVEGRWDAVLQTGKAAIPFRLDITGEGSGLKGILYNGDDTEWTTKASFTNNLLVLDLGHYLTKISATYREGQLVGKVEMRGDKNPEGSGFSATRHKEVKLDASGVPNIAGSWEIPLEKATPKGELAWRFIVKQNGAEASASTLRVDGDTGALTGAWHDGKFILSHFDGSRPGLLEVTPLPDGTLQLVESASNRPGTLIAYRPEVARAKGFPQPADYVAHSSMRDPNEVFAYKFPDVNGKVFSNEPHLEEMMAERNLFVDHVTIWRWVQRYAPELNRRCRSELRMTNRSWRVDETYLRVAGRWTYLYRAVDSTGATIDFLPSARRDAAAAKRFFQEALRSSGHPRPRVINVDGNPSYPKVIGELRRAGELGRRCWCRPVRYLNNIVEQDHRAIKRRVRASQGFRSLAPAMRTIQGIETMNMIRKGQVRWLARDDIAGQVAFVAGLFGITAPA